MNGSPSTSGSEPRHMWFEPFLQQVKEQLGYPFDVSKYAQLLNWANKNPWPDAGDPFGRLYAVCRLLFLQNHEHEDQFRLIFRNYILSELDYEKSLMAVSEPVDHLGPAPGPGPDDPPPPPPPPPPNLDLMKEPPDAIAAPEPLPGKKYLNLKISLAFADNSTGITNSARGSRFLLNDGFFPLTARQMIHGWKHLRKKAGFRPGRNLDVFATVQQIAREGMLVKPVFEKEPVNSDKLLLILADRGGSMTPFHKLTDKLIETAVGEGGHKNAMVYYFYNCPVDHVYKSASLTGPVSLTQLYSEMQPLHTNALIISDAGAARGNMNKFRALKTLEFLYGGKHNGIETPGLHKSAMFVSWLNPMPVHRWKNTTASYIDRVPDTPMYSIMEEGYCNFLNIIEKLMGS